MSLNKFVKSGNIIRYQEIISSENLEKLESKTYALKCDVFGFYFEEMEKFSLPKKIYGNNSKYKERIINTFFSRKNSTGVLLSGLQGSGKSLLIKDLSLDLLNLGIPTILINQPFYDENFKILLSKIKQDCFIVFDEFEKVYSEEEYQESLLSLFDGVYINERKLILFSANNMWKLSQFLLNRPGRIFYHFKFKGMEECHIRSYCEDKLSSVHRNKEKIISDLISLSENSFFNFDLLQAFVEDINRYPDNSIGDLSDVINISFTTDRSERFEVVKIESKEKTFEIDKFEHQIYEINLAEKSYHWITFYPSKNYFSKDEYELELSSFDQEKIRKVQNSNKNTLIPKQNQFKNTDLVSVNNDSKIFIFESDELFIHLRKIKRKTYQDYGAF